MEKLDTIIIGAGAAGLSAARDLHSKQKTVVLEGRDRMGGRIYGQTGAEFVHGKGVVYDLAQNYGLKLDPLPFDQGLYISSHKDFFSPERSREIFLPIVQRVHERAMQLLQHGEFFPSKDALFDADDVLRQLVGDRRKLFKNYFMSYHAAETSDLSVADLDGSPEHMFDAYRIQGGFDVLISRLAEDIDVRCNQIVESIEQTKNHVFCTTRSGERYRGEHVIVTLPLGVLKSGSVKFDPGLPLEKKQAFNDLNAGEVCKVFLKFQKPVWPSDLTYCVSDKDFHVVWPSTGKNELVAFIGGTLSKKIQKMSETELQKFAQENVAEIFGEKAANFLLTSKSTDWNFDPMTLGTYSSQIPGTMNVRKKIAQNVGHIVFAGEAASDDEHAATVDGAILSGQRAAKEVMSL